MVKKKKKNEDLLLDGSKMSEEVFNKRFRKIVGVGIRAWESRKSTKSAAGSEWYEYNDGNFFLGGTAYAEPKLYKADAKNISY